MVNIQGDEPFIDPEHINLLVDLISRDDTQLASLAKKIDDEDDLFGSNKVKVVMDKAGNALYFSRNPIPYMRNVDRKLWMKKGTFYQHLGLYAYKTDVLRQIAMMKPTALEKAESLEQLRWLENGLPIRMAIVETDSIAVDSPADLEKAIAFAKAIE